MKSQEVYCAHFAQGSPEQRVYEEQSARDWETFLLCRANELVPGKVYTRIRYSLHHVISVRIHCKVTFLCNAIIAAVAPCHSEKNVKRFIKYSKTNTSTNCCVVYT